MGELPENIRIAEGGFDYDDDEEGDGFDAAEGSDEVETKQAVDINDI